jgi:hypothetical protein
MRRKSNKSNIKKREGIKMKLNKDSMVVRILALCMAGLLSVGVIAGAVAFIIMK